jgi:type IV secretion system protein VirD4
LNNLKTKIILPGLSDIPTLNYISDLCGFKEVKITNEKGNTSTMTKKLFTPEEVRCIDDENELLIIGNKYPIVDQQNTYYKNKKYVENL